MVPVAEENDTTTVVVFKLIITVLTLGVVAFTTIGEAIRILRNRISKGPNIGFTKGHHK